MRDLPLIFVYFQVNNGVLYYRDYVEDIYIRALSVLVSTLNPNIVFTTSNKLYTAIRTFLFSLQALNQNLAPVAQRYHVTSDTLGREFDLGKRDFSH